MEPTSRLVISESDEADTDLVSYIFSENNAFKSQSLTTERVDVEVSLPLCLPVSLSVDPIATRSRRTVSSSSLCSSPRRLMRAMSMHPTAHVVTDFELVGLRGPAHRMSVGIETDTQLASVVLAASHCLPS